MRIPKEVFAAQFGYEEFGINLTEESDTSRYKSEILLGMNKLFTS